MVVAFSATRVYELAERIRGKRGGAAVVIGALSPRARNAQVALFQSGEVDTLVATDAIGMGLNLDVDNVVFADLRKFDGREAAPPGGRRAGPDRRAGRPAHPRRALRHPRAAGAPAPARPCARSRGTAFRPTSGSSGATTTSTSIRSTGCWPRCARRPTRPWLRLAEDVEDLAAATALARMPEVRALAGDPARVALLWEVCQIPDFRQLPFDDHFKLLAAIYQQLCRPPGRLDRGWIEGHLQRLERPEGDLETLLARMSAVRTWTYITSHRDWVDDAPAWQTRTHDLEDRLSDALHRQLVQRFVDSASKRGRRAPARARPAAAACARWRASWRPRSRARCRPPPRRRGARDPRTTPTPGSSRSSTPPTTASRSLADGRILAGERVGGAAACAARTGCTRRPRWPGTWAAAPACGWGAGCWPSPAIWWRSCWPPCRSGTAAPLGPAARGLLYQLEQGLGTVAGASTREQLRELAGAERSLLEDRGIVLGRLAVYAPALLEPAALEKRWALCAAEVWPERLPPAPAPGGAPRHVPVLPELPPPLYEALGFPRIGDLAVRADELERIGREIARGAPARRSPAGSTSRRPRRPLSSHPSAGAGPPSPARSGAAAERVSTGLIARLLDDRSPSPRADAGRGQNGHGPVVLNPSFGTL